MTLSRDTLIEAAVIGGTAGLFAAGVNIAARYTADPGDVLGFIGGAVGAGAAVVGALWLERRKANDAARDRVVALGRMLVGLAARSHNVLTIDAPRQMSAIQTLRQTIGTFLTMRATHMLPDPEAQALLDTFAERAEQVRTRLKAGEAQVESGQIEPDVAVEQVRAALTGLIRSVAVVFTYQSGWPAPCRAQADALAAHYPPEP